MTEQTAREWDEMDAKTQEDIKARLTAACDTEATAPTHRHIVMQPTGRLAHLPGI